MQASVNIPLAVGALFSAVAALLHLGIIAGGPAWYRFFGAGERFARAFAPLVLAKGGRITPFVTWSSAICLVYGAVHLVGLIQRWAVL